MWTSVFLLATAIAIGLSVAAVAMQQERIRL